MNARRGEVGAKTGKIGLEPGCEGRHAHELNSSGRRIRVGFVYSFIEV